MVALNSDYPSFDPAKAIFSEDILTEIADLRAHGKSWEETAKAVEWDAEELSRTALHDPNYEPALERARDRVADETNDEGLAQLRELTKCGKPETALQAHQIIRKYLVEQQKNKTRLAVERMRLQGTLARASAKSAKQEKAEEVDEDAPRIDPVDGGVRSSIRQEREFKAAQHRLQEELSKEIAELGVTVWLWAGDHRLTNSKPGPNDTPLKIVPDQDAMIAGKRVYWAVPVPEPACPVMGPYLDPAQCKRLPSLEDEVLDRILKRHKGEGRPAACEAKETASC
jgi:hypothetical protein